jgi:hypothetical protein
MVYSGLKMFYLEKGVKKEASLLSAHLEAS